MDDRTVSTDALSAEFQAVVDADAAAKAVEVQRTNAVAKANALAQGIVQDAAAFKAFVLATFGKNAATLANFDLKPRRSRTMTAEGKSVAAKKAKATRQALGTKGKKQKEQAKKSLANQPAPAAAAPTTAPTTSSKQ